MQQYVTAEKLSLHAVLEALTRERLFDLARFFGIRLRSTRAPKAGVVQALADTLGARRLGDILRELGRDELRAVCRSQALPADAASREALIRQLADAAGVSAEIAEPAASTEPTGLPSPGQGLLARSRQWLVEAVERGGPGDSPLLRLACLDDDAPGQRLELLWDLEVGAQVTVPAEHGLGTPQRLDEPAAFGAYLHALAWSAVSTADATLFQAPGQRAARPP